ncbi:MAG: orotate phosphoribosyltransferase [Thermodesulfovibrionia bacterium]
MDKRIKAMKRRLIELILERAFRYSEKPSFKLASGRMSNFYFNCKPVTLNSDGMRLIGNLMFNLIKEEGWDIKGVGGLTLGADPIADAIAYTYAIKGETLEAFVVRKERKGHGTMAWIEGGLKKGDSVLIVEDVITTGGSSKKAIDRARRCGLKVIGVIALIDRQEGGREVIEKMGLPFKALLTKDEIFDAYKSRWRNSSKVAK